MNVKKKNIFNITEETDNPSEMHTETDTFESGIDVQLEILKELEDLRDSVQNLSKSQIKINQAIVDLDDKFTQKIEELIQKLTQN